MATAIVLGLSVGIQLVAAGLALRLMTTRINRFASVLVVLALLLMAARRIATLTHAIVSPSLDNGELIPELIGLSASVLVAFGLAIFEPKRLSEMVTWTHKDEEPAGRDTGAAPRPDVGPDAVLETMPLGYAFHRIVVDGDGHPIDYVFLEVNKSFEEQTGLKRAAIIGKPVTEVLPTITRYGRNWIADYGRVALSGEVLQLEDYAAPLQRWYAVTAYAPRQGYFVTLVEDVTERKIKEVAARRHGLGQPPSQNTLDRFLSNAG
jgi:PAS domain-containing protein